MGDWECGVCVRIFSAMADGMERLKRVRGPKFLASHHYSPANSDHDTAVSRMVSGLNFCRMQEVGDHLQGTTKGRCTKEGD